MEQKRQKNSQFSNLLSTEFEITVPQYRELGVICALDGHGHIVDVNVNDEEVFGYDPNAIIGRSFKAFLHPDDQEAFALERARIVAGRSIWGFKGRCLLGGGGYRPMLWTVVWIDSDDRFYCCGHDVTQVASLEAQLRQTQRLEALGKLTGGVAHDFNNLLLVIIGAAETLQLAHAGEPAILELADMIRTAGDRGAELTSQLLAFGRQQPLEPRAVDTGNLLAGMGGLLRRTLTEDVELLVLRPPGVCRALCDPAQLEAAVLNLAINSHHAMPTGGKLTIECKNVGPGAQYNGANPAAPEGDYVMIAVSDTGEGMAPDVVERAFEPFFTTKAVGKGSGLGLSTIHGFIRQSKGNVRIYSEVGAGTTVRLYLPRADAGEEEPPQAEIGETVPRGSEIVFLVEDDDLVRNFATSQLESLGYTVIVASSGVEALALLPTLGKIDLLFTDVVMPGGVDGRLLADRAVQSRPGLKVLYTSGYTENAIVHHGKLDDGVSLLSKPYQNRSLALKLREVLDHGR